MFFKIFFLNSMALTVPALASDITVTHRYYSPNQCAYFSSLKSDFNVTYSDENREPISSVVLVYGLKWSQGSEYWLWTNTNEVAMRKNTNSQFAVLFSEESAFRSGGEAVALQFVFRIESAEGQVVYDKGNDSIFGYYEADLSKRLECSPGAFYFLTTRSIWK